MAMHPHALDRIRAEPEALDADMTPIADTLKRLHFTGGAVTIKLDKDVRDFLVAAVTRQGERQRCRRVASRRQARQIADTWQSLPTQARCGACLIG